MTEKERLVVALDTDDPSRAQALVSKLLSRVGMFKVGKQLFTAAGPDIVRAIKDSGAEVFLDLKYHDIPNTVAGAVKAAASLGVALVNVHALGGAKMIEAAREALGSSKTRLLAVTLLTSHDERSLEAVGIRGSVAAEVERLARLAQASGAHGVVASPREVSLVRAACGGAFLIVTPGIRPEGHDVSDQVRIATPRAALEAGADFIVVGRPITGASDPAAAADAIVAEMSEAAATPSR